MLDYHMASPVFINEKKTLNNTIDMLAILPGEILN